MAPCSRNSAMSSCPNPSSARTASVCSPRPGTAPIGGSYPLMTGGGSSAWIGALRRTHLAPAVARGQLRMNDHLAGQVVARVSDPRLVGHLLDLGEIVLCTPGSDGLFEDLSVRAPAGIGGETRVVGEVGPVDDLRGDPLPLPVVGGAEHHGLPVAGRERPVRRDRGRADPERLLVDAGVLGVGQLIAHHVGHALEQAQSDRGCGPRRDGRARTAAPGSTVRRRGRW